VWGIHNEVYHPHGYTAALTQSVHDLCKLEDPDRYTVAVNGYGHAEHPANGNTDIQGMNRYFGWYEKKIQDIKPWIEKMEKEYPWQRLMLTEYGAAGGGFLQIWYEYGFIIFILFVLYTLFHVFDKNNPVTIVFWFFLVFLAGINSQMVWLCIFLLFTIKFYKSKGVR
jgi:hypothetical protein